MTSLPKLQTRWTFLYVHKIGFRPHTHYRPAHTPARFSPVNRSYAQFNGSFHTGRNGQGTEVKAESYLDGCLFRFGLQPALRQEG